MGLREIGMSFSRHVKGRTLDAAYDYLNGWISGWPGAVMARQGYYISTPELTRPHHLLQSGAFGMAANLLPRAFQAPMAPLI